MSYSWCGSFCLFPVKPVYALQNRPELFSLAAFRPKTDRTFARHSYCSVRNYAQIANMNIRNIGALFIRTSPQWTHAAGDISLGTNSLFVEGHTSRGTQMHKYFRAVFFLPRQRLTPPLPHVQLVIMVRPFKTQQRVSEECSVSLIELRPINGNSLAVAFFSLLPQTAFFRLAGIHPLQSVPA